MPLSQVVLQGPGQANQPLGAAVSSLENREDSRCLVMWWQSVNEGIICPKCFPAEVLAQLVLAHSHNVRSMCRQRYLFCPSCLLITGHWYVLP